MSCMVFVLVLNSDIVFLTFVRSADNAFLHYQNVPEHCKSHFKTTQLEYIELVDILKWHFQVWKIILLHLRYLSASRFSLINLCVTEESCKIIFFLNFFLNEDFRNWIAVWESKKLPFYVLSKYFTKCYTYILYSLHTLHIFYILFI